MSSFRVPAFKPWVPSQIHPWIYMFFALSFQLSGGRYLGALNAMIGEEQLMREDLLMALYCNLAGMALYFPILFRMKFRFTNFTLLRAAAWGIIVTNLLIPYTNCLPLLWTLCFIEGICKLQGTFECISSIQLWMTPTRDFRVFFPILHLFIMGSINVSSWLGVQFAFGFDDWRLTHFAIAGLMFFNLLAMHIMLRHFRFIPKTPLWGIDWVGMISWIAFLLQICYLLCYGDWMDWYSHPTTWVLTGTSLITFGLILYGMLIKPHAYISRKVFKFRHVVSILVLITVFEALLAAENVLEEIFFEECAHLSDLRGANRYLYVLAGSLSGCGFCYWWLKLRNWSHTRLGLVATFSVLFYMVCMYFLIDPNVELNQLWFPLVCRGFAATVMSIVLMVHLNYSMDFHTFFQGLSLFNIIHMAFGGCVGADIYGELFGDAVADSFARYTPWLNATTLTNSAEHISLLTAQFGEYMEAFVAQMLLIGVRECYGWAIYATLFLIALFLIYDMPARRYSQHRMLPWRRVGLKFFSPWLHRKTSA